MFQPAFVSNISQKTTDFDDILKKKKLGTIKVRQSTLRAQTLGEADNYSDIALKSPII